MIAESDTTEVVEGNHYFAASSLREKVPALSWLRMLQLQVRTPIILKLMTEQMLQPPAMLMRAYDIPREVVREAYGSQQHRDNVLGGNTINGMIVRSDIITTQSVWDDADIVHVMFGEILTANQFSSGGVRLERSPTGSLEPSRCGRGRYTGWPGHENG